MTVINEVYLLVQQLMAKHGASGYLPPDEFDRYCLLAQNQKLEEDLQDRRTTLKSDAISNFIVNDKSVTFNNGLANLPTDYRVFESAYHVDFSSGVAFDQAFEELESDEFNWRKGSELDKPTLDYPALVIRNGLIEIAPKTVDLVKLTYVKIPDNPNWGYVTPVVSRYVYDENATTDFTYDAEHIPDLSYRILKLIGVEVSSQELYGAASREQQIAEAND